VFGFTKKERNRQYLGLAPPCVGVEVSVWVRERERGERERRERSGRERECERKKRV
jgi:hypothetical protein